MNPAIDSGPSFQWLKLKGVGFLVYMYACMYTFVRTYMHTYIHVDNVLNHCLLKL